MTTMLDKVTSDKLIKFYGGKSETEAALRSHNKFLIMICPRCNKVDINVLKHPDECDPLGEQQRQEANDVYWK